VHSSSISGLTPGLNLVIATEHSYLKQRKGTQQVFSLKFCAKFFVRLLVSQLSQIMQLVLNGGIFVGPFWR